ncbi:GNAT family N-acetyltransferase [Planomonospora corallina]|uniref:GNAT family N-acetyltransferase n=1 Tax=Planomonospora corallina TaxID=1806052 RepID=A0ABV8IHA2_9ACTN
MNVSVGFVPEKGFFEATVDGEHAGQLELVRQGDVIVYTHTEVDPAFGGRGVGGALVRAALDAARAEGATVRPRCSFVKDWIDRHPTYADLVENA